MSGGGEEAPEEEDGIDIDSEDDDEATSQKKKNKKRNKRRKDKDVMTVERSGMPSTFKKAKTEVPGKEVAACTDCWEAAAAEKAGKRDGSYCKIHRTKRHDLSECHQVEQLIKKQRAEYEKRDKEKDQVALVERAEAAEQVILARLPSIKGNPPEAMKRRIAMTRVMKEMKRKPTSRSSRKPVTPSALTGVHLCTPLTANLSGRHRKSMPWRQRPIL